ncbi:IS256 family transposase [Streptococcus pneumoniae]
MKSLTVEAKNALSDFVYDVNHKLMGDFVSMSNDEILRFQKMEKLLENKISRRFKIRRLDKDDFGYLIEHLYGQTGTAYEEYEYHLSKKKLEHETLIKTYDLIKPTRCLVEEKQRYLKIQQEDETVYVAYFTINSIVGELDFPSSEIFYYQQQQFTFPIDTSMNVEIVANRKALSTVRNKKKELKDLDNHAWQSDNETSSNVAEALESVNELETNLDQSKESMYKLSYVVRVSANDLDELKRRCNEVKDFYDDLSVKLVRPFGDMLGLHEEFLPASKRYMNDYIQYVTSDFLAGLGFGATQMLGENEGIYVGYSLDTGRNVYLKPALASQGVKGSVTNALASAFVGSLGGGKSVSKSFVSSLTEQLEPMVNEWQNRLLSEKNYPYLMTDVLYIKVREENRVLSKSCHIAIGITKDGDREIIGFMIQSGESEETWTTFFEYLKERGLQGTELVISDAHKGLVSAIRKSFTNVSWQRCQVHFLRNIFTTIPKKNSKSFREAVKGIFKFTDINLAREAKNRLIHDYIDQPKYSKACASLDDGFEDAFQYTVQGNSHNRLKSTNLIERLNQEVRRREKIIRIFPNQTSANRLIGAVLMDLHDEWIYSSRKYINFDK